MNTADDQQEPNPSIDEARIQLRIQVASRIYPELIRLTLQSAEPGEKFCRADIAEEALLWADTLIRVGRWSEKN